MRSVFTSTWVLGLATLIVFPLLAWFVVWLSDGNFQDLFLIKSADLIYLPSFLSAGIFFGLAVIWLTELKLFRETLARYRDLLKGFRITRIQAFFLSACAGIGEEIFFRGAIQPLIGIWITAFLFVAIHGYFSFKDWKLNIFSICLTAFIAFLGWSALELSIWHAITGHFSYDLVLLLYHRRLTLRNA